MVQCYWLCRLSVIRFAHAALISHANATLVMWAASSPNNLANRGLLVVGPNKAIECGTGSVNIWAAGLWRGSELRHWTLSLFLSCWVKTNITLMFLPAVSGLKRFVWLLCDRATTRFASLTTQSGYWGAGMHCVCLICITLCSPTWNGTHLETNVAENCHAIRLDWKFI